MPEHEIAKHTEAIYKTWKNPDKKVKEKVFEIFIEIAIIVFAITLSLLLERWRENAHDRKIERSFLIGLKRDLQNDTAQLKGDSATYFLLLNGWNYMRNVGMMNLELNKDSMVKYSWTLNNSSDFIANDSRFDALKSSGQLDVIEDDSLKSAILSLYQDKIKVLLLSTGFFTKFKTEQLMPFLAKNFRISKNGETNISALLNNPEMQNYLLLGNAAKEIMERYHAVIEQSIEIISMIDRQYTLAPH